MAVSTRMECSAVDGWLRTPFSSFSKSVVAQVAAAASEPGSYSLAKECKVRRPRRRGRRPVVRATVPPPTLALGSQP